MDSWRSSGALGIDVVSEFLTMLTSIAGAAV